MNYKKLIRIVRNHPVPKRVAFWLISTPPLSILYKKLYARRVQTKVRDFKLSDLTISIEPANVCNSRCLMCPYRTMTRPKVSMSMELFTKIIDDCHANGIRGLNLNFYNEPFLDPLIFERIAYAKSKGFEVTTFSNGSLLNRDVRAKVLASGIDGVNFSFDGFSKQTYERIRQGLNFETVRDNILNLVAERNERGLQAPRIMVMFVQSQWNAHEAEEFKRFWEHKVDYVGLSTDDNRAGTADVPKRGTVYPCRKLWTELIVMSSGRVALCCFDYDGKVVLGDFRTQTLQQIWDGEAFTRIRQLHLQFRSDVIGLCKNCLNSYRFNSRSWFN